MMSVYAVMIKDAHGHRWIDSLWVRKHSWQNGADERVSVLKTQFEAMNACHTPYVIEMKLEDGALDPSQRASDPEPAPTLQPKQQEGDS